MSNSSWNRCLAVFLSPAIVAHAATAIVKRWLLPFLSFGLCFIFKSFQAETGDIIVFDQQGMIYFWKCFLRTSWNHVGIVVEITGDVQPKGTKKRHRPGKYLLEAVSPSLELNPLKDILNVWLDEEWNPDLHMIGYRKLVPNGGRPAYNTKEGAEYLEKHVYPIEAKALQLEGRAYEEHADEILAAVFMQDSATWRKLCCGCPCVPAQKPEMTDMEIQA